MLIFFSALKIVSVPVSDYFITRIRKHCISRVQNRLIVILIDCSNSLVVDFWAHWFLFNILVDSGSLPHVYFLKSVQAAASTFKYFIVFLIQKMECLLYQNQLIHSRQGKICTVCNVYNSDYFFLTLDSPFSHALFSRYIHHFSVHFLSFMENYHVHWRWRKTIHYVFRI